MLSRKEIENYLLVPSAIDRSIEREIRVRAEKRAVSRYAGSTNVLKEITDPLKDEVFSQLMARRHDYFRQAGKDTSRLYRDVTTLEKRWSNLDTRLSLIPGKEVLRQLRQQVQSTVGVTLTEARIVDSMSREDIAADMRLLLTALDEFRIRPH